MSQRLNLSQEEGEKWIVNLIRDTRVDAKIDFEEVGWHLKLKKKILTFFASIEHCYHEHTYYICISTSH